MANFVVVFAILLLLLFISQAKSTSLWRFQCTNATTSSSSTFSPQPPPRQSPFSILETQPPTASYDDNRKVFSLILVPILSHFGFKELATAVPLLAADSSSTVWTAPFTLFAPSDSSLRSCYSCSVPDLLREHIVPDLFTIDDLSKLAFGTRIETLSPGRCITVTSISYKNSTTLPTLTKVFIDGLEITHPHLFNNRLVVIHGIQGYLAPLFPFSCENEILTSLSFLHPQPDPVPHHIPHKPPVQVDTMLLILRESMIRLSSTGFSVLSESMKLRFDELVKLSNMTVFALDDSLIFSGLHSYISAVGFHIVPNNFLTMADLENLPEGATLPTLERGQSLVVTTAGGAFPMRINNVRVKVPNLMRNHRIIVHSVYFPFEKMNSLATACNGGFGLGLAMQGSCSALKEQGGICSGC